MADMHVSFAGVEFKNPVTVASGTFAFGREYAEYYDLSRLGGICVKGLTPEARGGNPSPRIAETPMGIPASTPSYARSCPSCAASIRK